MTDAADFDLSEQLLPGLEPPTRPAGEVEAAARRTIAALVDVLDERHAVLTQALVTAARQLDRAAASDKAKDYGVANLLVQLRETFLVLMPDAVEGGDGDAFDELAADLRRAATVRDPAQP